MCVNKTASSLARLHVWLDLSFIGGLCLVACLGCAPTAKEDASSSSVVEPKQPHPRHSPLDALPHTPQSPVAEAEIRSAGKPAWFVDVAPTEGIGCIYRNGDAAGEFTILESLGGGVAVLDADRDGLEDLYFTGGGEIGPGPELRGRSGAL